MRILAISSFGGHWIQLNRLSPMFEKYEVIFATCVHNAKPAVENAPVYFFSDCSESSGFISVIRTSISSLIILYKSKADVVITTGALPGLISIVFAKVFFRKKTIWVDSIANVEQLSKSGRYARYFADIWLTQWPHLSEQNGGPKYLGSVI